MSGNFVDPTSEPTAESNTDSAGEPGGGTTSPGPVASALVASPPGGDTQALLLQTDTLTFTSTQQGQNGVVTQIAFTVTTDTYVYCDGECTSSNDLRTKTISTAVAEKGSGNTNKELTTQRLDLAADVVAQTIASATALGVNDIPTILGIVARESYFGIVKGGKIAAMQSDINPMKLTQNQFSDGTQPKNANEAGSVYAARKHNIQNAIRLFIEKGQDLSRYGPAKETTYRDKVGGFATEIRGNLRTTTTYPFVLRTISTR
ncbi:MAG: hypothetical protein IPJ30_06980 [Acidobacteria bacterium]|nr:hypothetical protein [Acidobacteriota bacterium]